MVCWNTAAPKRNASSAAISRQLVVDTSCPTTIAGFCAAKSRWLKSCKTSIAGTTLVLTRVGFPMLMSSVASSTSPGKLIKTGPVGGVSAILDARWMIRGRSESLVHSVAHFTSGCAIGTSGS